MNAGSRISLISKSDIRYEGFLHAINAEENTVALKNVRMFGTEGRKGDASQEIAPGDQLYDFIIFRGADIKDLTVFEEAQEGPRDPAIVRSKLADKNTQQQNQHANQRRDAPVDRRDNNNNNNQRRDFYDRPSNNNSNHNDNRRNNNYVDHNQRGGYGRRDDRRDGGHGGRGGYHNNNNNHHHMNNNNNNNRRGGRGGMGGGHGGRGGYNNNNRREDMHTGSVRNAGEKIEFKEDYDFEKANQMFKKDPEAPVEAAAKPDSSAAVYKKSTGFFDTISSETSHPSRTRPTRTEREAQQDLDRDTFGETGHAGGFRRRGGGGGNNYYRGGRRY